MLSNNTRKGVVNKEPVSYENDRRTSDDIRLTVIQESYGC